MADFVMPSLGADMESATVVHWRVAPGDRVERGQVVAEVETEKGVIDVEIFQDGVIDEIVVPEGVKVRVGAVLARVRAEGEPRERTKTSPAARTLAAKLGVDIERVEGTGPSDSVTLADVQRAAGAPGQAAAAPATPAVEARVATEDARRAAMRASIAALMSRSKREIPHYYLAAEIDLRRATAWLEAENGRRSVQDRILPAALLLKAVASALHEVPEMNGLFVDGAFRQSTAIHVGVAIALRGGGLIAPAIRDTDHKSVAEVMAALRDLVRRARSGGLRASEMSDPTITVTNIGEQGVATVFGVIYPPQVAIVGFGKPTQRAHVEDGAVVAATMITTTLSADHRVSDGHRGALFLAAVDRRLQQPESL